MSWNPALYHKFQKERFAPFQDLINLILIREGLNAIDLGCGTGELTELVSNILPNSKVLGIDTSPNMLEGASERKHRGLDFKLLSIQELSGRWDLIFSNAAIQWVENHNELIPRLFSLLHSGGQIAVQLPANHNHPTQRLIAQVANEKPYKGALDGWQRGLSVLSTGQYARLLYECQATNIDVFEKVYIHVLKDVDSIIDWLSGTAFLPYFERLPDELHEEFVDRYREELRKLYPKSPIFYIYQRIFFSAIKPVM